MHEIYLESIDSTNTYAKQHASHFAKDAITCITAETQTGGRGRFQKTWASPPGVNLYLTFFFRLSARQPDLSAIGLVLAASLASVLIQEGLSPQIKWPNDLQLGGKKMSGILCEISRAQSMVDVILGIGVNVNMEEKDLLHIGQAATSLKQETKRPWDRKDLLQKLQAQFEGDLASFKIGGFAPFHNLCERLLAYKEEKVRCLEGHQERVGICDSLAMDGRLNIRFPDHSLYTLASGEISLRKV